MRAEGAGVAIASRNPAAAATAIGAAAVAVDLAAPTGPAGAVARTVAALGGLDVLVNNVGAARIATFEELTDADWHDALEPERDEPRALRSGRRCPRCGSRARRRS